MKENTKKIDEGQFKSFADFDLSKIPGSASEILTTNFERFNACRTFDEVVALCHELFGNAKLDTEWTRKFFYNLEKIRDANPNPRKAFEQAMLFMNNARMKGMGLGMDRGARKFNEEEAADEEKKDSCVKEDNTKKYTKKQIAEAIAYWKKQLEEMDEPNEAFKAIRDDLDKVIADVHDLRASGDIDEETADDAFGRIESVYEIFR